MHNKPLAATGLKSYRYKGLYGFIMIGAIDDQDALKEAMRSTSEPIDIKNLQIYNHQLEKYCNLDECQK